MRESSGEEVESGSLARSGFYFLSGDSWQSLRQLDAQLENGGGCGAATVYCLETRDAVRHSYCCDRTDVQDKKESSPNASGADV